MQYSILSKAFSTSFSFFQFLSVRKLPFPFILHPVDYIIIIFFQSRDESNVILCGSNNSRNTITLHAPNKYHLHSHWLLRLFDAKGIRHQFLLQFSVVSIFGALKIFSCIALAWFALAFDGTALPCIPHSL